jgi:hypothetical protein
VNIVVFQLQVNVTKETGAIYAIKEVIYPRQQIVILDCDQVFKA